MPVLRSLLTVLVLLIAGVGVGTAQASGHDHHGHHHHAAHGADPGAAPVAIVPAACDHGPCHGACGHPLCLMAEPGDPMADAAPAGAEPRLSPPASATFLLPLLHGVVQPARAWPPPLIHHHDPTQKQRVLRL